MTAWAGVRLGIVAVVLSLGACASSTTERDLAAIDALARYERGDIVVIDVRSSPERQAAIPRTPMPHVPFGPDPWSGAASEHDESALLQAVAEAQRTGKAVALLCEQGVRSAAAARWLAARGYGVMNIRDGYRGNAYGPGWKAWE